MIAGVLLGPSLLGMAFPDLQAAIFPKETRNVLYAGAQLGVGLYMFLVGTTLQLNHFQSKARSAVGVSLVGIAAPFFIAFLITPLLLGVPGLFATGISQTSATLFMGACIALTAFPMLARIVNERGLANTSLGTLSLTAGAFDDACSWCVLAIVLATFGAGPGVAILAIGGGFILGAVMPRGLFAAELKKKVEPLAVILLLPMFFTYSGLNTRMDMVNSGQLLLIALGVLIASVAAKGGACCLAARLAGEDNRTALGIGALMNSRGLMELIIINIGLQKGIIGPTLFSMLALMAVVTTMMASPPFELFYGRRARESGELGAIGSAPVVNPAPLVKGSNRLDAVPCGH
jgi:Kef-type K+ transport system membrane component KefB